MGGCIGYRTLGYDMSRIVSRPAMFFFFFALGIDFSHRMAPSKRVKAPTGQQLERITKQAQASAGATTPAEKREVSRGVKMAAAALATGGVAAVVGLFLKYGGSLDQLKAYLPAMDFAKIMDQVQGSVFGRGIDNQHELYGDVRDYIWTNSKMESDADALAKGHSHALGLSDAFTDPHGKLHFLNTGYHNVKDYIGDHLHMGGGMKKRRSPRTMSAVFKTTTELRRVAKRKGVPRSSTMKQRALVRNILAAESGRIRVVKRRTPARRIR